MPVSLDILQQFFTFFKDMDFHIFTQSFGNPLYHGFLFPDFFGHIIADAYFNHWQYAAPFRKIPKIPLFLFILLS